ncbi:MAG: YafY family protein [Cyclobacteriaceae bacterium]
MNRIDRLTAILVKLQSKRTTSAQEISEHFDISLRTVYRDIRALGEAGVPIGLDQGKGYFIVEGYHLPPVMLNKEEAGAVLLAGKLIEKMGDKSVSEGFNSALAKIRSVLSGDQRDFVENLDKYVSVIQRDAPVNDEFPDHFLADIKLALVGNQVLEFDYYSKYKDNYNSRQVEPFGLVFYGGHWHLFAYCRLRQGIRDFRTDRIMKLVVQEEKFEQKFSGDYKSLIQDLVQGSEVQQVRVAFSKKVAPFISEQRYYYGYVSEEVVEDKVIMTYMAGNLNYFARWLMMFGADVDVLEPDELREEVVGFMDELTRHYSADLLADH